MPDVGCYQFYSRQMTILYDSKIIPCTARHSQRVDYARTICTASQNSVYLILFVLGELSKLSRKHVGRLGIFIHVTFIILQKWKEGRRNRKNFCFAEQIFSYKVQNINNIICTVNTRLLFLNGSLFKEQNKALPAKWILKLMLLQQNISIKMQRMRNYTLSGLIRNKAGFIEERCI